MLTLPTRAGTPLPSPHDGGGLVRIARVMAAGYTENDFLSGTFFNGNVDWHAARLFRREVSTLESTDL